MKHSQYTPTAAEIKARTHEATISKVFAAKERHDRLVQEAMERTARENPQDAGNILWV